MAVMGKWRSWACIPYTVCPREASKMMQLDTMQENQHVQRSKLGDDFIAERPWRLDFTLYPFLLAGISFPSAWTFSTSDCGTFSGPDLRLVNEIYHQPLRLSLMRGGWWNGGKLGTHAPRHLYVVLCMGMPDKWLLFCDLPWETLSICGLLWHFHNYFLTYSLEIIWKPLLAPDNSLKNSRN
jgi:hypothetical protein